MKQENIVTEVKSAIDVALFKEKTMHAVASDKERNSYAFLIIILAAILSGLGMKLFGGFFTPTWWMMISAAIFQIISTIIAIYIMSVIAKSIFKGQAKHDAFFRVMAYGLIVTWLSIVPAISIIGGLWALVLMFVILKKIHKLTTGGALGTLLVTLIVMALIGLIITPTLAALGIKTMPYGGGYMQGGSIHMDGYRMDSNEIEMNFETEDGSGSFEMDDGKVTITGPDGSEMTIEVPTME